MSRNRSQSVHPFLVGVFGNLGLAVLKMGFGLFGGSRLVLMDGLFSFMSSAAFLLPWQAQVLEKKTADIRYPYGVGKVLFISTTVVGLLGLVIGVHMLYYSLIVMTGLRMYGSYAGAVMVTIISIVANVAFYRYLMEENKKLPNTIISSSARYNRIDVWISCFVLFFLILIGFGAGYLERAGVAVISIIVLLVGLRMVFTGFAGIMDKVPPRKVLDRIRSCARKVKDVRDIVSIKARYVGTLLHIDMSIAVDEDLSMENADQIARNVKMQVMGKMPSVKEVNVIIA